MKAKQRKPDLTLEVGENLVVFSDRPRSKLRSSAKVITSYDPSLTAVLERKNGNARPHLSELAALLDDCLRTAGAIKTKRATELVKKLKSARRQVDFIR